MDERSIVSVPPWNRSPLSILVLSIDPLATTIVVGRVIGPGTRRPKLGMKSASIVATEIVAKPNYANAESAGVT